MITEIKKFFIKIIQEEDFDSAVDACRFFSELVNSNFLNSYDFHDLEDLIFDKFLEEKNGVIDFKVENVENISFLHVITEGYQSGGHTRLMERVASMHDEKPCLLVTRRNDCDHFDIFDKIFINKEESYREAIFFIFYKMAMAEKIFLHIHPDDILSVLAVKMLKNIFPFKKVYFINHADHQFSFGRSVCDFVLQIGALGPYLEGQFDLSYPSSFLGIPLKFDENNFANISHANFSIFYTAGSSWKFKPIDGFSFQKKIRKILNLNKSVKFYAVGVKAKGDWWWWRTKLIFWNRLKLFKAMPYGEYLKFISQRGIYFDSYPISGGTAFVEAYIKGNIPIGFKTLIAGFTPLDNIRIKNAEDVCNIVLNPRDYCERLKLLNNDIVYWHSFSHVKERFNNIISGVISPIPSIDNLDFLKNYPILKDKKKIFGLNFKGRREFFRRRWFYYFILKFFYLIKFKTYPSLIWKLLRMK